MSDTVVVKLSGTDSDGETEKEGESRRRSPHRGGVRLTDRDRQLLQVLNEARVLSHEQLRRLFFAGRDESTARQRMKELDGLGLVTKLVLRRLDRPNDTCWSLSPQGQSSLAEWVDCEVHEGQVTSPEYLEHHLFFTGLYVELLAASLSARMRTLPAKMGRLERQRRLATLYVRAEHPKWRWRAGGVDVSLPWREYIGGVVAKDRLIRPDAILEFPDQQLRVFVEGETGSQPVRSRNKDRHGATVAKLDRYLKYVTALADVAARKTWYQARFEDRFAPELLVLLPTGRRLGHVQEAVSSWRKAKQGAAALSVRTLTVEEALRHYGAMAGGLHGPTPKAPVALVPVPAPTVTISVDAARSLIAFFQSTRADLKRRQAEAFRQSLPTPAVPAEYEAVKALVAQLSGNG